MNNGAAAIIAATTAINAANAANRLNSGNKTEYNKPEEMSKDEYFIAPDGSNWNSEEEFDSDRAEYYEDSNSDFALEFNAVDKESVELLSLIKSYEKTISDSHTNLKAIIEPVEDKRNHNVRYLSKVSDSLEEQIKTLEIMRSNLNKSMEKASNSFSDIEDEGLKQYYKHVFSLGENQIKLIAHLICGYKSIGAYISLTLAMLSQKSTYDERTKINSSAEKNKNTKRSNPVNLVHNSKPVQVVDSKTYKEYRELNYYRFYVGDDGYGLYCDDKDASKDLYITSTTKSFKHNEIEERELAFKLGLINIEDNRIAIESQIQAVTELEKYSRLHSTHFEETALVFFGSKVVDGKIINYGPVASLEDLPDDYRYVKRSFYEVVKENDLKRYLNNCMSFYDSEEKKKNPFKKALAGVALGLTLGAGALTAVGTISADNQKIESQTDDDTFNDAVELDAEDNEVDNNDAIVIDDDFYEFYVDPDGTYWINEDAYLEYLEQLSNITTDDMIVDYELEGDYTISDGDSENYYLAPDGTIWPDEETYMNSINDQATSIRR